MTKIAKTAAPAIAPRWEHLPDRAGRALTELTTKLGKYASKLDIDYDRQDRIVVRMSGRDAAEATVMLKKAGVKEYDTGIRKAYSFNGVEVAIAPYQSATLA